MQGAWGVFLAGIIAALFSGGPAIAQESDVLVLGVGIYDFTDYNAYDDEAVEGRIEYRSAFTPIDKGPVLSRVRPLVGAMANNDGGAFVYGGLYGDFRFGDRLILQPAAGAGAYNEGNSRDLGGVFQFHLGFTAAIRFGNDMQLGVTFAHISNASIHGSNPGVDSLLVTLGIPIGRLF